MDITVHERIPPLEESLLLKFFSPINDDTIHPENSHPSMELSARISNAIASTPVRVL